MGKSGDAFKRPSRPSHDARTRSPQRLIICPSGPRPQAADSLDSLSRVIFYWLPKEEHINLLTVYAKGAKDDLTGAERDARRRAVEAIDNG